MGNWQKRLFSENLLNGNVRAQMLTDRRDSTHHSITNYGPSRARPKGLPRPHHNIVTMKVKDRQTRGVAAAAGNEVQSQRGIRNNRVDCSPVAAER